MKKKCVGGRARKGNEGRRGEAKRLVSPTRCADDCGLWALGNAGKFAYCPSCWYARRAAEILRQIPVEHAREIVAILDRLIP